MATAAVYPRLVAGAAGVAGVALRWWAPSSPAPNPDELFTGVFAQSPPGELVDRLLTRGDTHPPLDYLLRHPFVGGGSLVGLRLVSILSASAALVVVWWWMRGRGWFGALTVLFTAVSPFLLFYGRLARPYSPLILASTVVALAADRWSSGDPRARRWCAVAGGALLVGLLLETSAALVVLGALLLPGARRDRAAWEWRAAVAAAGVVWAVAWGWRVPGQYHGDGAAWIPLVGPGDAVVIAGSLVSALHPAGAVAAVVACAAGLVLLAQVERGLARLCVRLALVPLAAGLVAAAVAHIGLARSFSAVAWAPPLLLAGLVVGVARRSPLLTAPVVALVAIIVGPSLADAFRHDDGAGRAVALVRERAAPGDLAAISPPTLDHVLRWTFGTDPIDVPGVTNAAVVPVGGGRGAPAGRLWVVGVEGWDGRVQGRQPCPGGVVEVRDVTVRCFEPPEAVAPPG